MTSFYIGLVDRGGEGWGVTFPDLAGCTSGGRTMTDLFEMSIEAVRLWAADAIAAGETLPEPRSVDVLLNDADVQETLRSIGPTSFLQVPLLLDAGRSVRANVSFDASLLEAIDSAAKRRGLTRSAFLASAARDKIARGV